MSFFVAEIGSNHNRSIERIEKIIKAAAEAGFWGVKLQLFHPDGIYADIPKTQKARELTAARAIDLDMLPKISDICRDYSINLGATIFSEELLDEIGLPLDFYKISSFDILRTDLIRAVSSRMPPASMLMMSAGMATVDEVAAALGIAREDQAPKDTVLLHCVSLYPTKAEGADLNRISTYRAMFKCMIGYSDHTAHPGVIYQAWKEGAHVIEMHVDLDDMLGCESIHGHCWSMTRAQEVITNIRTGELAMRSTFADIARRLDQRADPIDGLRPMMSAR